MIFRRRFVIAIFKEKRLIMKNKTPTTAAVVSAFLVQRSRQKAKDNHENRDDDTQEIYHAVNLIAFFPTNAGLNIFFDFVSQFGFFKTISVLRLEVLDMM